MPDDRAAAMVIDRHPENDESIDFTVPQLHSVPQPISRCEISSHLRRTAQNYSGASEEVASGLLEAVALIESEPPDYLSIEERVRISRILRQRATQYKLIREYYKGLGFDVAAGALVS